MDKEQFWQLITESKQAAGINLDNQTKFLIEKLKQLPFPDILDYRHFMDEYLHLSYTSHLWAVAFITMGGCSDDSFDYFRGWLIAQGKEVFDQALGNPDSLLQPLDDYLKAKIDPECENMWYVAIEAYEQRYNKFDFYDALEERYPDKIKSPTMNFDWEEDDEESLSKIAPIIFAKYWN